MQYICNTEEHIKNLKEYVESQNIFAYDIEYISENKQFLGLSVATKDHSFYIPFQHETNMPQVLPSLFFNYMKDIFESKKIIKAGHGMIGLELGLLEQYAVRVENYFDTIIAHWLVDENTKQGLKDLMLIEYGQIRTKFKALPKNYPIKETAEYCMLDAENTLQLYNTLLPLLKAEKIETWFWEVEMPLIKILLQMNKDGFPVDLPYVKNVVGKEIAEKIIQVKGDIFKVNGTPFNLEANKQMAEFLFDKLKLPATQTTAKTGSRAVNEQALKDIENKHPIVKKVLEYKGLQKLESTYIQGIAEAVEEDGRIHSELVQFGTKTGRFSCRTPNSGCCLSTFLTRSLVFIFCVSSKGFLINPPCVFMFSPFLSRYSPKVFNPFSPRVER